MLRNNHIQHNNINNKNQKVKFHDKLDEDDYDGQNLLSNLNGGSEKSQYDIYQKKNNGVIYNKNTSISQFEDIDTEKNDIIHIEEDNQQQKQSQTTKQLQRKQSLEHIQEKFQNQIDRKQKIKEYYNSKSSRLTFRQTLEEESRKNTRTQLHNLESYKNTFNYLPTSKLEIQTQTASARTSFKYLPLNESVSSHSIKSSLVDFFNENLAEMSEARKRDMELKKMKLQEEEIIQDKSLSEDQRRVKLDNLKHSFIADKVKNIIEKKKLKDAQNKPANKEQKFEMSMRIFKKLDTYLETKDYFQKINSLNEQNTHTFQSEASSQLSEIPEKIKKTKPKKSTSSKVTEENDDYDSQTYKHIEHILQKTNRHIKKKNNNILTSKNQTLCSSLLEQFEKDMFGKTFTQDTENHEQSKYNHKHNFQNVIQADNQSDTNIFFNVLQYQLESGYFYKYKAENEKKKLGETSSVELTQQNGQIQEVINERMIKDQSRSVETKEDVLQNFRKRANKITKLLLNNSKNILKRNIEDTNNAILQARKAKTRQKIQQQLNIKNLEKTIKQLPQKFSRLEKIKIDGLNQDDSLQLHVQTSIEMQKNQDKIDKMEETIFKQKLLNELHPDSPSAKKKDIDSQLKNIESAISSLNSSGILSDDVKKIRNSFDRRFTNKNESKGIIPRQSSFYKNSQEQTPTNSQNYVTLLQSQFSNGNTPRMNKKQSSFQIKRKTSIDTNKDVLSTNRNKESFSMSVKKDLTQEYKEMSPFSKDQNYANFNSQSRFHTNTDETVYTKQTNLSSDKNKFMAFSQNYKNSPSFHYQTGNLNFDTNQYFSTESGKRDMNSISTIRGRTESVGGTLKVKEFILDKITKGSKQNGFSVRSVKQIVNDFREEEKKKENQNKFIKLSDYSIKHQNKIKNNLNSPISSSSVQYFMKNNGSQKSQKFFFDKINQMKNNTQDGFKSFRLLKDEPNNEIDYFTQQKTLNQERSVHKNASTNNIFLTQNTEASKINYPSERDLICNFLPNLSSKHISSNSTQKLIQNSKSRFIEDSPQNNSNLQNNGVQSETSKHLDGIISKMNNYKLNHESEKGYFDKQIAEIEQILLKQQENLTPQPLESLRLCMSKEEPYIFKNYVYNRKAVQKIL